MHTLTRLLDRIGTRFFRSLYTDATLPCPRCHGEGDLWVDASDFITEYDREGNASLELDPGQNLDACDHCAGSGRVPRVPPRSTGGTREATPPPA